MLPLRPLRVTTRCQSPEADCMPLTRVMARLIAASLGLMAGTALAHPQLDSATPASRSLKHRGYTTRLAQLPVEDSAVATIEVLRPQVAIHILRPRSTLVYRRYVPGSAED